MSKPLSQVDAYIADAAPFARPILKHLRALVRATCPEAEEAMKWSSPFWLYHGKILCNMAAFKAHVAFGFWHQGMEKIVANDADKSTEAMGLLGRITQPSDLPSDAKLRSYLKQAMALTDAGAPARPRLKEKRPELPLPPDLAARLKASQRAGETWRSFTPSHRREYIEWIVGASEETREKRLETTMEKLTGGE